MSDAAARIVALLAELVALQKAAGERQLQMLERGDRQFAEARERSERAIGLQKTAVDRQRRFVRAWAALIVFVIAVVVGLLIAVSRYLH